MKSDFDGNALVANTLTPVGSRLRHRAAHGGAAFYHGENHA